jgi:hypothetical protein
MGLLNVDPHNSPRHWRDFRGENLESESSVPYGTTSLVPRMHYSIFCSPDGVALFLSLGSDTASDKPDDPFANAPIDGFLQVCDDTPRSRHVFLPHMMDDKWKLVSREGVNRDHRIWVSS